MKNYSNVITSHLEQVFTRWVCLDIFILKLWKEIPVKWKSRSKVSSCLFAMSQKILALQNRVFIVKGHCKISQGKNELTFETLCPIWYNLYNLKNVNNIHRGAIPSVKLQGQACNFTKNNTPLWMFSHFFNCIIGIKLRKASQLLNNTFCYTTTDRALLKTKSLKNWCSASNEIITY